MSVLVTGDCHGDFSKFSKKNRTKNKDLFENVKYVIVCGDFGLLWEKDATFYYNLEWLSNLPFTILWVQGNHDNYSMISEYPVEEWHGGKVRHIVRDKIILLERGQIFDIEGHSYFTFGGARSHDISDGILDPNEFKTKEEYRAELFYWQKTKYYWRIKNVSWWEEELPTDDEIMQAIRNLDSVYTTVDYIISHCCSSEMEEVMGFHEHDKLTDFFNYIERCVDFKHWYFGHYHRDTMLDEKHEVLYHSFEKINDREYLNNIQIEEEIDL